MRACLVSSRPCPLPAVRPRSWLGFLAAALLFASTLAHGQAVDPYAAALNKRFTTNTLAAPDAEGPRAELEEALRVEVRKMAQAPASLVETPEVSPRNQLLWSSLICLVLTIVAASMVAYRRWRQWLKQPLPYLQEASSLMADDPTVAGLFAALREGPQSAIALLTAPLPPPLETVIHPLPEPERASPPPEPPDASLQLAKSVANLRARFSEVSRARDENEQLEKQREFIEQAKQIKDAMPLPDKYPLWLLTSAVFALMKQCASKPGQTTPSALRTTAAALDLLDQLRQRTIPSNLANQPPVRLLAVDDDPICRHTVSLALKKAFHTPDLAADGVSGLALAENHRYDVIFLDIEMPHMDGFELCAKIRETETNRITPIVFVTRHTDFDSRAKSTLYGAQDLIGKPFLACEIALKALTLILSHRSRQPTEINGAASAAAGPARQVTPEFHASQVSTSAVLTQ